MHKILIPLILLLLPLEAQDYWEVINLPNVSTPEFLYSTDEALYARSGSYLFKSINDGRTWTQITPNDLFSNYFSISPTGTFYSRIGRIIYSSTDEGETWNQFDNFDYGSGSGNFFFQGNSAFVVIGKKIYKSIDNGISWNKFADIFSTYFYYYIDSNDNIFIQDYPNLYFSSDRGTSWKIDSEFHWTNTEIFSIKGSIYALNDEYGDIFLMKFDYTEKTWQKIFDFPVPTYLRTTLCSDNFFYVFTYDGNNRNPELAYKFDPVSSEVSSYSVKKDIGHFPTIKNEIMYFSNSTDIFSIDLNLTSYNNLASNICPPSSYNLKVSQEGHFYLLLPKGVYRSTDNGANWNYIFESEGLSNFLISSLGSMIAIVHTKESYNLYFSDNGGSFHLTSEMARSPDFLDFSVDKHDNLYRKSYDSLSVSTDRGITWNNIWDKSFLGEDIYPELSYQYFDRGNTLYQIIRIDEPDNIYDNFIGYLYRYQNQKWERMNMLGSVWYFHFEENGSMLYNYWNGFGYQLVRRYPDGNEEIISNESSNYWSLFWNYDRYIVTQGDYRSLHFSADYGNNWITLVNEINNVEISGHVRGLNNTMYATMPFRFARFIPENVNQFWEKYELPRAQKLKQNYPNPFNPYTTIAFTIINFTEVRLEIFNSLGQKVETLINGFKVPGSYEIVWDANQYSSGVYFYRLRTNRGVVTKKMVLIK